MKKGNTMVFFQKLSKAFLTPLSLIASASVNGSRIVFYIGGYYCGSSLFG